MLFGQFASSSLYERAIDQFLIDARLYASEITHFLVNLTLEERLLALCGFIFFLIYIIVMRARRKYNPGSLSRQFGAAIILVGIVLIGSGILFQSGAGQYRGIFQL
ncbi:MAG: hypothetical protein AAGL90_02345 [Pseudomonadota bacterium]